MAELNYLRIAQILGGTLSKTRRPTFGSLHAHAAARDRLRMLPPADSGSAIPLNQYPLIARAFEETREGYEVDRVLIDPTLSRLLIHRCREMGVTAPVRAINKKLQQFRKSHVAGIVLEDATKRSGLKAGRFFYAAEMGYAALSIRERVSVDDIVTDPEVGDQFVRLCRSIDPRGTGMLFKWAAISLRKQRALKKRDRANYENLDVAELEGKLETVGALADVATSDLPDRAGVFALSQRGSDYLYVGSGPDLKMAVTPFRSGKPFQALAGPFWQPPDPHNIVLRLAVGNEKRKLLGVSVRSAGMRLIEEKQPLFNVPVKKVA